MYELADGPRIIPMTATTPSRSRARAAHLGPERRRPQVLDAALAIAVRDGIGAVNVRSVAQHLGVTRPVVYACFADRVEMIDALLDREAAALSASVLGALYDSGGARDPEAAFVGGFQSLLAAVAGNPAPWRFLFEGEPDPAISARFRAARAAFRQRATDWIRPAMIHWWNTADLDRKLPVLIEFFMASCESALRSLLDPDNDWGPDDLGEFVGQALHRAFRDA